MTALNETKVLPSTHAPPPEPPENTKRTLALTILKILVPLVVIAGVIWWFYDRQFESTDDAFIDGHVVVISPKVSAIVKQVFVDDNTPVKKGDLLVQLDDRDFQAALAQAQGDEAAKEGKVQEAKAQVDVAKAQIGQAEAELVVAQTNADNADQDYQRWLTLDERARSKQEMDNATAAQKSSAAQVVQAQAKIAAAKAQLIDAQMAVLTAQGELIAAQGELLQARNNISYCTISAETDGLVTSKNVEPGAYVQPDQAILSIVPTDVWVTANFKETQLDNIRPGMPVDIAVDAYPSRTLHGKVQSVQNGTGSRFSLIPPENATGNYVKVVQRVPVKIVLDPDQNNDPDQLLVPGMSVEPSVKVR
jgi:membrane fusion protein, multidrug efflux system